MEIIDDLYFNYDVDQEIIIDIEWCFFLPLCAHLHAPPHFFEIILHSTYRFKSTKTYFLKIFQAILVFRNKLKNDPYHIYVSKNKNRITGRL